MSLPKDPKDFYIQSEDPISLRDLAKKYTGKAGCGFRQLAERSRKEKWTQQRADYWNAISTQAQQKSIEKKVDEKLETLDLLNNKHKTELEELRELLNHGLEHYRKLYEGSQLERQEAKSSKIKYPSLKDLMRMKILLIHNERLVHNFNPRGVQPVDLSKDKKNEALKQLFGDLDMSEFVDYEPD